MVKKTLPRDLWETYRAMSEHVGRNNEFLRMTACMNAEQRALIAGLRLAKNQLGNPDFTAFVDGLAIPYIQELGQALWGRDVVTDLGFALAQRKRKRHNVSQALEYELRKKKP